MEDDAILLVGIDRIAGAISPHIGRHRVVSMIQKYGLPAYQLENKGAWMISKKKLAEWLEDFHLPPERV